LYPLSYNGGFYLKYHAVVYEDVSCQRGFFTLSDILAVSDVNRGVISVLHLPIYTNTRFYSADTLLKVFHSTLLTTSGLQSRALTYVVWHY